jgi:hypothetical protein
MSLDIDNIAERVYENLTLIGIDIGIETDIDGKKTKDNYIKSIHNYVETSIETFNMVHDIVNSYSEVNFDDKKNKAMIYNIRRLDGDNYSENHIYMNNMILYNKYILSLE